MAKNPFNNEFFNGVNSALHSLDAAANKQMEESKYTVDGVLIEKGLKVWCVDSHIGGEPDAPWEIAYDKRGRDGWRIKHPEGAWRFALYHRLFADRSKAIIFRIGMLKKKIQKILLEEVEPINKEVEKLVKIYIDENDGPIEDL